MRIEKCPVSIPSPARLQEDLIFYSSPWLSDSDAKVVTSAVNGVEQLLPVLQTPVAPLDLQKLMQKRIPQV